MTEGCCWEQCGDCPGDGGRGALPDAEELAKQLAGAVWPELYNDLVAIVEENIDLQPDEESRAYWQAVYDALAE